MKTLKFSTLLVALATTLSFSSCLDEGNDIDYPNYSSYVTITGDATFGYTFYSDGGYTLKPTTASVKEVLPGLANSNVKRAMVAFDLTNDPESVQPLEAGKTYDVTLRTSYSSNYAIPTYNTIDATGIDLATDTLTTNNDPIYFLSKNNYWAANGYLNASISVIYDPYKTFYMNTFYDYEKDIDVENNTLYLNLYYNNNTSTPQAQGSSIFSFALPIEASDAFTSNSIRVVLRAMTNENRTYNDSIEYNVALKDFYPPM